VPDPARPNTEHSEPPAEQRLDSWKEIAAYLRRGARTVQRWEREQGLPVHRLGAGGQGQVFAYKSELDAWWRSRQSDLEPASPAMRASQPRRWLMVGAAASVLILAAGTYLVVRRAAPPAAEGPVALAVLPFQNLSGDPDQDFFSDGLTEEMITQLARLPADRLRVIARSSVMPYKGSTKTTEQIGRELGVTHVLEGTVRREGDRARITAQLVRVKGQTHVWAESFDRELGGILAIQNEVAQAVARQIRLTLDASSAAHLASPRPVKPEALMAYLKGRHFWNRFTAEAFAQATELFQRATQLDPTFARAWLGLSDCYRLRGSWWGDLPPKQAFPPAKQAALEALQRDPTLGEAHAGLGWIHFVFDWDWSQAESEFKRGIQLTPNSRDTHGPYANFLRCMVRVEEARTHIEKSLAADPLSPLELGEAALIYLYLGDTQRAGKLMQEALELDPEFPPSVWGVAALRALAGKQAEAIAALEQATRGPRPDRLSLTLLGSLYSRTGKTAEARKVLQSLLRHPEVGQLQIANLYLRLGDRQKALEWHERAFEERDPQMVWYAWAEPAFPLWNEPRFQTLLRRMNFPPGKPR